LKFWTLFKAKLKDNRYDFLERVGPNSGFSIGFSKGAGKFGFCIGRNAYRVELYIANDQDKKYIDAMLAFKSEIEAKFQGAIKWERLENKKASRIRYDTSIENDAEFEGAFQDENRWGQVFDWYIAAMNRFYDVILPFWERVQQNIH
jgi:hypothetical protein